MSDYESESEVSEQDEETPKYKKNTKTAKTGSLKDLPNLTGTINVDDDEDNDEDEDDVSSVETEDDADKGKIEIGQSDDEDDDDEDGPAGGPSAGEDAYEQEIDGFKFGFDSNVRNEDDDDYSEEDEEDDSKYLQKLDDSVREHTIANHHPELILHNYEEISALCTVVRDANGRIIDPLHRTLPFLTKYERTRILGERARQINEGAKPFIKVPPNIIDGYIIALAELEQQKLPFIVRRPLSNGMSEYWKLKDLEILA